MTSINAEQFDSSTNNDKKEKPSILKEAESLIFGQRADDYGPPKENFNRIAKLWSAYLGYLITEQDVIQLMILLKSARVRGAIVRHRLPTYDSLLDQAGYVGCSQIVLEIPSIEDEQVTI